MSLTSHADGRAVPDRLRSPLEARLKSWESLLILVAVAIFVANSFASPYFLNAWNLSDATFNFTEKAMIASAMALLSIAGEIDLSVASIIALASTAMGAAVQMGAGAPVPVGVGLLCGAFDGVLVTRLGRPSIVGPSARSASFAVSATSCWAIRPTAATRPTSPGSGAAMSSG